MDNTRGNARVSHSRQWYNLVMVYLLREAGLSSYRCSSDRGHVGVSGPRSSSGHHSVSVWRCLGAELGRWNTNAPHHRYIPVVHIIQVT